jgi:hypothetical protein
MCFLSLIEMKKQAAITGILVSALILFTHGGFCSKDSIPDNGKKGYPAFYTHDLVVDGNPAEWPSKLFYNNNDAKVLYAVANDSSRLFFCLEVLDQQGQMAVLHEGIVFWADPTGKKKETCSIRIIAKPKGSPPVSPKQKLQQFTGEIKAGGFRESFNGTIPFEEKGKGFQAAIAYDEGGALIIEGCIPLQAFPTDPNPSKGLSLGFKIEQREGGPGERGQQGDMHGNSPPGGMQDDMGGGMQGGGQGGGQGMGGGRGNGRGQGGGQHDRNGQQDQSKTYKIWHKFSVAKAP